MTLPLPLARLLRSRKFWLGVFGLVSTIVLQFFPNISPDVWKAIDGLIAVLIASIAYQDAGGQPASPQTGDPRSRP